MALGTVIATTLGGIFTSWLDRRGRIKEAQASIENAGKVIDGAGWKGEFVIVIWSCPVIMAFIPGMQDYTRQGFENLKEAPEWYLVGWLSMSLAIYGLKPAIKKLIEWRSRGNS